MSTRTTTPQPGALDGAGLRRVVTVLSVTQITSWGILYYAFAALSPSITDDTGWSSVAVTGAFSLSQFISALAGIWVGRRIDAVGPRALMTAASVVAVPGVALVALAPNRLVFFAGWSLIGAAMAGVLYPPAFAAVTRWGGAQRIGALTTLTLVGGLASTVFAPLTSELDDRVGWRATYLVLAMTLGLVTVPLHWWGLRQPWRKHVAVDTSVADVDRRQTDKASLRSVTTSQAFVLLTVAMALTSLSVFAVVINLVPMLVEQGMSRNTAAFALGLGGLGQVAGRLGYTRLAATTSVRQRSVGVLAAVAAGTVALAVAPGSSGPVIICISIALGLARGLYTLVSATAITDRWGPDAYGTLNGLLTAPSLVAAAAAPFVGAALAHLLGSYAHAFLLLGGLALIATGVVALAVPPIPVHKESP